jgi:hypothetical protein
MTAFCAVEIQGGFPEDHLFVLFVFLVDKPFFAKRPTAAPYDLGPGSRRDERNF